MLTISKEWVHVLPTEYYDEHYYKVCNRNGICTEIHIISKDDDTYAINKYSWLLWFDYFPGKEYHLMYGDAAKYKFSSLEEAQDHVDSFLVKLEKLMVFL